MCSWLHYLRLGWWRRLLTGDEDTLLVRAILFGQLCDGRGSPMADLPPSERPYGAALLQDLRGLRQTLGEGTWDGANLATAMHWFLSLPTTAYQAVLTTEDPPPSTRPPPAPQGAGEGSSPPVLRPQGAVHHSCPECGKAFPTHNRLQAHGRLAHGHRDHRRDVVTGDKCPACLKTFSDHREAKRHFSLRKCPQSRTAEWEGRVAANAVAVAVGIAQGRGGGRARGRGRGAFQHCQQGIQQVLHTTSTQPTLQMMFASQQASRPPPPPPGDP